MASPTPPPASSPSPSSAKSTIDPAPFALTPRSKVRALLADFDSDEDDAANQLSRGSKLDTKLPSPENNATNLSRGGTTSEEEDEDTSEDEASKPRGKLASRLQTSNSQGGKGSSVYERIRKQLTAAKTEAAEKHEPQGLAEWQDADVDDASAELQHLRSSESPRPASQASLHWSSSRSATATPQKANRQASLGLFISPEKPGSVQDSPLRTSKSTSPAAPKQNDRLQALLARKREELQAKEREQQALHSDEVEDRNEVSQDAEQSKETAKNAKSKSKKPRKTVIRAESENDDNDEDNDAGKKLTQQARPTRKASKKALEEMNRETQRMSRNMQLTHEAKTKIKFTKEDFFKKFNFGQSVNKSVEESQEKGKQAEIAPSSSAPATSDAEPKAHETPPSSPPSDGELSEKKAAGIAHESVETATPTVSEDDEEFPDIKGLFAKIKEKQHQNEARSSPYVKPNKPPSPKKTSVRQFEKSRKQPKQNDGGSDDDLEIIPSNKPSRLAIFDNVRSNARRESTNLVALRALADLNGHEKQRYNPKGSMSTTELQAQLHRRARDQAKVERDEKIQALRDKGVIVQTAEEKERDQLQLDSMLERARQEAQELAKKEREEAKRDGKETEDSGLLDSDDEEDGDYDGGDEEEIAFSGSDEEQSGMENEGEDDDDEGEDDEDDELDVDVNNETHNDLIDEEAGEDSEEDEVDPESKDMELGNNEEIDAEDEILATPNHASKLPPKARRTRVIVSDDEDELGNAYTPNPNKNQVVTPGTSKKALGAAFGFNAPQPAQFGMSQLFAGTMAEHDTQDDDDESPPLDQQDSLEFLRGLPPPDLAMVDPPFPEQSQSVLVEDSQTNEMREAETQDNQNSGAFHFETQSQVPLLDTQAFDIPDATQDVGFQSPASRVPPGSFSTVDTVIVSEEMEQPIKARRRLQRRLVPLEDEDIVESSDDEFEISANAFDVMKKAAKKRIESFDKTKSGAKEMVEEQAEESEDEYAGLGGASEDEDNGEGDEEVRKIIDDESNEKVDEVEIAAYYADKERQDDEKLAERLYKDIANGGLRRKRGADMDLWDSDDEDEAAARRRAAKQREFAKMRRALLADEKIGKIAENPKQAAFLQAIEDRDEEEDDLDLLDQPDESQSQIPDSQNDSVTMGPPLRPISANAGKRKHSDFAEGGGRQTENQHPAQLRRTNKFTKPTSLLDVRSAVSELIGESESIVDSQKLPTPDQSSDEEDLEITGRERISASPAASNSAVNARRTPASPARNAVIDRMALRREASSSVGNDARSTRLAFHAPSSRSSHTDLRTASLLRRATASSTSSVGSESQNAASNATAAAAGSKEAVKMGGSKKSSVNYYVREQERKAKVEAVEKERMEGRIRVGKMRRNGLGLGKLAGGSFG